MRECITQVEVADNAQEVMTEFFTTNAPVFEQLRDELMAKTGDEIVLRVVYRNADGSEIFGMKIKNKTFYMEGDLK